MANILYGVNGEGAGHSTRAKEVLSHLAAQGHAVHVASFDRGLQSTLCRLRWKLRQCGITTIAITPLRGLGYRITRA